jgi:hypothetical protein
MPDNPTSMPKSAGDLKECQYKIRVFSVRENQSSQYMGIAAYL